MLPSGVWTSARRPLQIYQNPDESFLLATLDQQKEAAILQADCFFYFLPAMSKTLDKLLQPVALILVNYSATKGIGKTDKL